MATSHFLSGNGLKSFTRSLDVQSLRGLGHIQRVGHAALDGAAFSLSPSPSRSLRVFWIGKLPRHYETITCLGQANRFKLKRLTGFASRAVGYPDDSE
jgi:hypothetical protein